MKIEILDTGSALCKNLLSNVLEVIQESGKSGRVVVVRDIKRIMKYGVMATPTLVIDGVVMFSGRLGSPEEILALLHRNISTLV